MTISQVSGASFKECVASLFKARLTVTLARWLSGLLKRKFYYEIVSDVKSQGHFYPWLRDNCGFQKKVLESLGKSGVILMEHWKWKCGLKARFLFIFHQIYFYWWCWTSVWGICGPALDAPLCIQGRRNCTGMGTVGFPAVSCWLEPIQQALPSWEPKNPPPLCLAVISCAL